MITWLRYPIRFPPVSKALTKPNGLLAAGGDLSSDTLLMAYRQGIFPWYQPPDPILWWSPTPRTVLFPDNLHIAKSMQKTLKQMPWQLSCDRCFTHVMRQCAAPRHYTSQTWISDEMIAAYSELHKLGYAHSVEVWHDNQLIGGLYGVAIGCLFFGESMFSVTSNASKFAFIHLVQALKQANFQLIDCQVASNHLHSLGAIDIPRQQFISLLNQAITQQPLVSPWVVLNNEH